MWAELAVTAAKVVVVALAMVTTVPIMVWVERRGAAFIQDLLYRRNSCINPGAVSNMIILIEGNIEINGTPSYCIIILQFSST